MTCVNMIYYHLIAWLGDRGLNSQDHLLISANTHCGDGGDKSQISTRFAGAR